MPSNLFDPVSPSPLRRTLMLVATLSLAALGWFLLDEPEAVGATESRPRDGVAVAVVDGIVLTEEDVLQQVQSELAELEVRRAEILARAVDSKVCDLLIEVEARNQGIDRATLLAREVDAKIDTIEGADLDDIERYGLRWQAFLEELRQRHEVEVLTAGE